MKFKIEKTELSILVVAIMLTFSTVAYAGFQRGSLVELSSVDKTITIQQDSTYEEKLYVTYKVADKAKWHICLKEKCIKKEGVEGFLTVNEYAQFGDYGIPHKSYRVLLDITGDTVTSLEVQIITKMH